jgi:hypothetical protein
MVNDEYEKQFEGKSASQVDVSIRSFDIDVPMWMKNPDTGDFPTVADIQAILEGGCDSGAWMPAVTYYDAKRIMAEHGDEICEYLDECVFGNAELKLSDETWGNFCVRMLSAAIERKAALMRYRLEDIEGIKFTNRW